MSTMKTSTIVAISVGTVASGILAYAIYFDYRRRHDPDFRRALKRESRRQVRLAKEAAEMHSQSQKEEIKQAVREVLEDGFPTDMDEREQFFMDQIARGEQMAGEGSDPIGAALCFYKGLKVYPEPKALINIYDNTVPKDVLAILAEMVAQDPSLNVGAFGASGGSGPGSESGKSDKGPTTVE